MVTEVMPDIFLIEVPLAGNPLKNLNSYFIRGDSRSLLIDTGFNNEDCYKHLKAGLDELDADMEKTDVFLTHLHADHSGLCTRISSDSSKIFMSEMDRKVLQNLISLTGQPILIDNLLETGFSKEELAENSRYNPAVTYRPPGDTKFTDVHDGEIFQVGRYRLQAIETPGHTPGHMCLYDEDKKLFFSGDHIIFGITPNITTWNESKNSLGSYLQSLENVRALEVETTFSAHRQPVGDFRARIDRLIAHHIKRIDEALRIVQEYPDSNAYEIASRMRWRIKADSWSDFPIAQKWFATGEAAAHLQYLVVEGKITMKLLDNKIVYR